MAKVAPPPPPTQSTSHDKGEQYHQNYYPGYAPYHHQAQQRPMPVDNRWIGYQQPVDQRGQGQQVYNPLNPMAGKYQGGVPPPNPMQMGQQTYKNPMMGRPQQQGQYYDPRYQGSYQQQ